MGMLELLLSSRNPHKTNLSRISTIVLALLMLIPISLASAWNSPCRHKRYDLFGQRCLFGWSMVQVASSNLPSACSDSQIGYIGWNLMQRCTTPVQSAELTLTTYNVTRSPGTLTFELVTPTSHTWTEMVLILATARDLATTTATLTNGESPQTTFGGSGNMQPSNAIGAYFQRYTAIMAAPSIATIGVRISGGCLVGTNISFNDSENSGSVASSDPDLIFYTGPGATAITLSTLTANTGSTTPYPLLAALIGLTAAALVWIRRR